jgi:MFS family permease
MGLGQVRRARVDSGGFRWYTGAQAVSVIGTMMSYAAVYWLTIHLARGDALGLSVLVAAQFLPILLFSRRAGMLVARYRPRRVLVCTQSAQAAGSLAIGIPLLAGWMAIWYLCAVCFVVGCVIAVDLPARQMFMLDLVGDDELRRGTSLYAAATGLAKVVGPGAAGVVIAVSGEAAVFFVDAASFLVVLAVLARAAASPARMTTVSREQTRARRFRWVLDLPRSIQVAAGMALLIGGFGYQYEITNPLMATKVFHLGSVGFGLMGTCMAVGGIAASYWSSRRGDPRRSEFLMWAALFGGAELLSAVMPVIWAYDIAMVIVGAATQLFTVSATVYVQKTAPPVQRGHALTAYNSAFMGFVPVGAFAVAGAAAAAGTRWALIGPGLVIVVCALVLIGGAGLARPPEMTVTPEPAADHA